MQLTKRSLVVAVLAGVALFGGGVSRGQSSARGQRFLWGAWIGKQFTGSEPPWSWRAVQDFDAKNAAGRRLRIVHWGVGTPWEHDFNRFLGAFKRVQKAHAVSLVDMYTQSVPLLEVANGVYDSALRTWASEAERWGHPLLLRFDWEMNGGWFLWGKPTPPAVYVAAWRRVHDIFTAAGATNVQWVWCPNSDAQNQMTNLASLYPGSEYVDWTCLDGYNRGKPWTTFTRLFASTYHRVMQIAPDKPMIIGEVASTGQGGNKARWITNMFHALATRFPDIHGLVWYDKYGVPTEHGPKDWPIETSNSASAAFSRGIRRVLRKP